jgi:hypothetical protein
MSAPCFPDDTQPASSEPLHIRREATPLPATTVRLNFEAIVVNATHVSFFRNAQPMGTADLPRPVTDCPDSSLWLGDSNGARRRAAIPRPHPPPIARTARDAPLATRSRRAWSAWTPSQLA